MEPATTVVEFGTARDFLESLFLDESADRCSTDSVDHLLYRGVSDARYTLTPTALRTDPESVQRFKTIARTSVTPSHPAFQHVAEWDVIRRYYLFANRNALPMPTLPPELHRFIIGDPYAPTRDGRRPDLDDWPPSAVEPVLALAQHYGLPTRLLDWTTDALIAAYFAAQGAFDRLEHPSTDQPSHIVVWSTTFHHLEFANALSGVSRRPSIVHPPRSQNPNLAAQRGLFTLCRQRADRKDGSQAVDRRPLNEIVAEEVEQAAPVDREGMLQAFATIDEGGHFFVKRMVPIAESPRVLAMLQARGYDAGRLFPGYGGAALAVVDDVRMKELAEFADSHGNRKWPSHSNRV